MVKMSKGHEEEFEKYFLIMILVSDDDWLRCKDLNGLLLFFFFFFDVYGWRY
jgi:hypothetical protein